MKKNRFEYLYIKTSENEAKIEFSGIKFIDFIKYTPIPVNNMMLLKANYIGEHNYYCFELIKGDKEISDFQFENIYDYGDFCFVDYANDAILNELSEQNIAELFYLGNMHKPLNSPFFDVLQNKYAYLSHDDGWYSKIYCKDQSIALNIISNVIKNKIMHIVGDKILILDDLNNEISKYSNEGLLIEIEKISKNNVYIRIYEASKFENMDDLFDNLEQIKTKILYETKIPGV